MYATILLRALGYTTEELLREYYDIETITIDETGIYRKVEPKFLQGQRSDFDIVDMVSSC